MAFVFTSLKTPLIPFFDPLSNSPIQILMKAENLQPFGSYKVRGIENFLSKTDEKILKNGLSAASAGNMAQAVAFGAKQMRLPCTIYLPDSAPLYKKDAIKELGAHIHERPFSEIWQMVESGFRPEDGSVFIDPTRTDLVLKGYGKIADEIFEEAPDTEHIVIPFGLGGLFLGVAEAYKKINPNIRVFAAEIETAAPLKPSLEAGRPVRISKTSSFVDAVETPSVIDHVFERVRPLIEDSIVVGNDETKKALIHVFKRQRLVIEGAAAIALAAALKIQAKFGGKTACVLSGGNISLEAIQTLSENNLGRDH